MTHFLKGPFTNEVITWGVEMMTSLYFPMLFVKKFCHFDDLGGGGKNLKFLMRSFVNDPLVSYIHFPLRGRVGGGGRLSFRLPHLSAYPVGGRIQRY